MNEKWMNTIQLGDCLELMQLIDDKSIDMVLCDLPYGIGRSKWDKILPFDKLWEQYNRITKLDSAIVLFGCQPFTSKLILSNIEMFKYCWIWDKKIPIGYPNAHHLPLKVYEDICVFSKGATANNAKNKMKYIPQGLSPYNKIVDFSKKFGKHKNKDQNHYYRKSGNPHHLQKYTNYPKDIISFPKIQDKSQHPTQKPTNLLKYLIKTYTNQDNIVLDNCSGSGSTAVACILTNRKFICMEKNKYYYKRSNKRIKNLAKPHKSKYEIENQLYIEENNDK